jgi:large subunit ribosomal protein L9
VAGPGSVGDIVMVAPAFFLNKLQKTGRAVRITDEQVEKECAVKQQQDKEAKENANYLKDKLETMTLVMSKKAGPDGHLFGGVGYKAIFSELEKQFPKDTLGAKYIKITGVKDENGELLDHDIKSIGEYTVTIALLKDISADFRLTVQNE